MPSAQAPLEEPVLNRPSTANPKRPPSPNTQAIASYAGGKGAGGD